MSDYNADVYMSQGGASLVVGSSGSMTVNGTGTISTGATLTVEGSIAVSTGGDVRMPVVAITTASASTTIPAHAMVTLSSTLTAKSVSVNAPNAGDRLALHCLNASATGYVAVNVGSTDRTFDGTNYIYQFKKAAEHVEIIAASTTRWIEISRSVADGTALTSTST